MCGLAGCVVAVGRRPDLDALERMAAALEPRGPDGAGIEAQVGGLWVWTAEIWARLFLEGRSVEQVEGEIWRRRDER